MAVHLRRVPRSLARIAATVRLPTICVLAPSSLLIGRHVFFVFRRALVGWTRLPFDWIFRPKACYGRPRDRVTGHRLCLMNDWVFVHYSTRIAQSHAGFPLAWVANAASPHFPFPLPWSGVKQVALLGKWLTLACALGLPLNAGYGFALPTVLLPSLSLIVTRTIRMSGRTPQTVFGEWTSDQGDVPEGTSPW